MCEIARQQSKEEAFVPQKAILRCRSFHGESRTAQKESADRFRQLRALTHSQLLAPVMLTSNNLWNESVVPLGLMNGARGVLVAVLYKPEGQSRTGTLAAPTGMPRGGSHCPLPDLVIVHFPGYIGPAFFKHLPNTCVPVCCVRQQHYMKKSMFRIGLPLRLCWALTIHKYQGITQTRGCIIDFKTRVDRNPVASLGLAFVAWTRTTDFSK
jgi:hypothetical protein